MRARGLMLLGVLAGAAASGVLVRGAQQAGSPLRSRNEVPRHWPDAGRTAAVADDP